MDYYDVPRRHMNRVGFSLLLLAGAAVGSSYLINLVFEIYLPELTETNWYHWMLTAISMVGIAFPAYYAFASRIPGYRKREIRKLKASEFMTLFLICTAAMYLSNYIGLYMNFILLRFRGEPMVDPTQNIILDSNIPLTILYGTIIAPIIEEVMFRKILLSKLRCFGDVPAILYSGFAFGLLHMNLYQFFYATTLGIIFAYIAIRTETIRYTIRLHMMINFIGAAIAPLAIRTKSLSFILLMGVWVMVSIALGTIFFALHVKKVRFHPTVISVKNKSVFILNIGTILFTLFCLILMYM